MMKHLGAVAIAAALAAVPALAAQGNAARGGDAAKGQAVAAGVCAACHGTDGNSPLAANPNLAGQHAEYLVKQLRNYKSGERKNPIMTGIASTLSEDDMRNVAAYYAAQAPRSGAARDAQLASAGQALYRGGNSASGVAACSGCHSPNGAGIPVQYPRLKGQHGEYTAAQLRAFRSGERANDPASMMRGVAARMSDAEISAVAEYISGLK
jgi:cytochrome c553